MRSEYVYIAWALVIAAFTWQVNQPKSDLAWLNPPEMNNPRDRNLLADDPTAQPLGIIGEDERVEFSRFNPAEFPWSALKPSDFGASLILDCANSNGSASLVHHNDIIVFAAHQILDNEGRREAQIETCQAITGALDGQAYDVDWSTLKTGTFNVPAGDEDNFLPNVTTQDWAIARLKRPINNVVPYRLPPANGTAVTSGMRVANITSATDNWPNDNYYGMLALTCSYVGGVDRLPNDKVARYDCDTGRGASGSGLLAHDGVGGVYLFGTITDMNRGSRRCDSVGNRTCFTAGRLLSPDLAQAIGELAQPSAM